MKYSHKLEYHDVMQSDTIENLATEKLNKIGEKYEMVIRADVFFRLKQGEFITYADGKDKKVQFKLADIQRELPKASEQFSQADLVENFERVYNEVRSIFK